MSTRLALRLLLMRYQGRLILRVAGMEVNGLSRSAISKPKRAMARCREGSTPKRATASVWRAIHSEACSGLDIVGDPPQSAFQLGIARDPFQSALQLRRDRGSCANLSRRGRVSWLSQDNTARHNLHGDNVTIRSCWRCGSLFQFC